MKNSNVSFKVKNRIWIIVFSVAALVCFGVWLFISNVSSPTSVVGIYKDGSIVDKIDLNSVTNEYEITLSANTATT